MRISVIIPTLNEAGRIADAVRQLREAGNPEIIVVDGGSSDDTVQLAREADHVLQIGPGRAIQQNTGARMATGDVLLFLHADCRPAAGSLPAIEQALAKADCIGGCFQQRIDADGLFYRLLEYGNGLRARWFKWAYGDQGIFVRRTEFERVGGFPELQLMEDLFLMKRLRRRGRLVLLPNRLLVSPRRWQRSGIVRQTVRNWSLILLAHCGVSPNWLARFYPHVR